MSVLGIFDIAKTTLFATKRALDTVAHNVANAGTPGYTRQDVVLENIPTGVVTTTGTTGRGVRISEVTRLYDSFVSAQLKTEKSNFSYWDDYNKGMLKIENIFNEASGNGIGSAITDFFNAWQDVAQNPEGYAQRTILTKKAEYLSTRINRAYTSLDDERTEIFKNSQTLVSEINNTTAKIAGLNDKIASSPGALDLIDQRDGLIQRLNQIIKTTSFEDNSHRFNVLIGGTPLVDGTRVFNMSVATDVNNTMRFSVEVKDTYGSIIAQNDVTSLITGGELKASIDLRDTKIPAYMNKLNTIAVDIADTINYYHKQGFGLDGSTGNNFFNSPLLSLTDPAGGGAISSVNIASTTLDSFTVDGTNKTIMYSNGGPPTPLTLTEGTYTSDELAAELKTRLEIAFPGNTFTVTYDQSAKKFTVSNVAGPAPTINLLWTDPGTTAKQIFGFNNNSSLVPVGTSVKSDTAASAKSADAVGYVYDQYQIAYNPVLPAGEGAEDYTVTDLKTGKKTSAVLTIDSGGFGRTLAFNGVKVRIEGDMSAAETFRFQIDQNAARTMAVSVTDPKQVAASVDTFSVDSSNNTIIFDEGGGVGAKTITIPPGAYSGDAFAQALKTAFENANTSAPYSYTYTVVYNPGIKKFKVMNNGGNPNPVTVTWTGGGATAGNLFGFTGASVVNNNGYVTSSNSVSSYAANGLPGDNRNAKTIAGLVSQSVVAGGSPTDFYRQVVSDVGVETLSSKQNQKFQDTLVQELEKRRDELSGVSLDEEAANLVKYQKSFEAAAKMISVADELLSALLNIAGK